MTVERRALSGSIVTGLNVVVQFGHAIVLVPLFLTSWGTDKYGLWLALVALTELIITLDYGHQAFVGNELARLYPVDKEQMRRVLASAFWIALMLGLVELCVGAGLWFSGVLPAVLGNPEESINAENVGPALLVFLLMWATCGSVGGLLVRVMPPAGHYTRATTWGIFQRALLLAILAGGVALQFSILELMIAQITGQVLHTVLFARDLRNVTPDVYPFWQPADLHLGFRNLTKSVVLTATSILAQVQQSGLNILVPSLFGPALLPVLTTTRTLANVFVQGTAIVAAPLSPDVIRYHVKKEHAKLTGAWAGIWFVSGALVTVGLAISVLIVEPFYAAWTRAEIPLNWPMYLALIAAVSVKAFATPLHIYLTGLNHLRGIAVVTAVQASAVLGGTWLLAPSLGLAAAGAAILAAEVLGAIALLVFVLGLVEDTGMRFPWEQFAIAGLAPAISLMVFAAAGLSDASRPLVVASGLLALAAAIGYQWHRLPLEVKSRMLRVIRRDRPSG